MAGSFSSYHDFTMIAKRDIQAGEELFVDRTRRNLYPNMANRGQPTEEDYEQADQIVKELWNSVTAEVLTEAQWTDWLYRIRNEILIYREDKQAANLLPKTLEEMAIAKDVGVAKMTLQSRSLDSIRSNGKYYVFENDETTLSLNLCLSTMQDIVWIQFEKDQVPFQVRVVVLLQLVRFKRDLW